MCVYVCAWWMYGWMDGLDGLGGWTGRSGRAGTEDGGVWRGKGEREGPPLLRTHHGSHHIFGVTRRRWWALGISGAAGRKVQVRA